MIWPCATTGDGPVKLRASSDFNCLAACQRNIQYLHTDFTIRIQVSSDTHRSKTKSCMKYSGAQIWRIRIKLAKQQLSPSINCEFRQRLIEFQTESASLPFWQYCNTINV